MQILSPKQIKKALLGAGVKYKKIPSDELKWYQSIAQAQLEQDKAELKMVFERIEEKYGDAMNCQYDCDKGSIYFQLHILYNHLQRWFNRGILWNSVNIDLSNIASQKYIKLINLLISRNFGLRCYRLLYLYLRSFGIFGGSGGLC